MPTQAIEFKAPVKGINKDLAYSDFNPEFALDALNVLPFGTDNRRRVSQRPGTSKFYSTQLGSGAPVRLLMQTTIPFDATTASATNTALDETWTYANGTVNSVAATRWVNKEVVSSGVDTLPQNAAAIAATRLTVASNALHYEGTGNNATGLQLLEVLDPGPVYVYRCSYVLPATAGATVGLWMRWAGWGNDCVRVKVTPATITIHKSGTTYNSLTPGATPFGGSHALEVRVNGNVFAVYIDSVLKVSATTSDFSTAVGFGMGFGTTAGEEDVEVDNLQVLVGDTLVHNRQTNVVAVSGGSVYVGTPNGTIAVAASGTAALSSGVQPSAAFADGNVYFVDGTNLKKLVVSTATVSSLVATAGSLPTLCTLACVYRDRLVLAAPAATQQNFFMSRVGTHTDFDYSTTDSASAFAGNASTAGRIGDAIVALIPSSDDVLYIAGDHNIWAVNGDPADGGSIDLVTDAVGIAGQNAWCKATDGSIYFVGTGGLFKLAQGGVENLSFGKYTDYFRDIHRGNSYIQMAWDRDRDGAFIFVTPASGSTAGTHLWYDSRTGGLWPLQLPIGHGPYSTFVYDGDDPADRAVLFGSGDGYIRRMDESATSDDGTAISSYLTMGPVKANEVTESVLEWMDLVFGEAATTNVTATLQVGPTVERAINSPRVTRTRTFTSAYRQVRWMQRASGVYFVLKLANSTLNKVWAFEKAVANMLVAGNVRRR